MEGKGPLCVHLGSPQKVCISSRVAYSFVYDKAVTQSLSKKAEESSKGWPLPVTQVRERGQRWNAKASYHNGHEGTLEKAAAVAVFCQPESHDYRVKANLLWVMMC